jgi:hypothetical protein
MRNCYSLSCIAAFLIAAPVLAHHSAQPVYDTSKKISITGTVTRVRLVNPHAFFYLDVNDESGKVTRWTVEAAGRLALIHQGWQEQTLRRGDKVTFTGNPSRSGMERMFFSGVLLPDGRELLVQREASINAIEERRRQRAAERASRSQ